MNKPVNFLMAQLLKEKNVKIDTDDVLFYRDEVNNIEEHQIKNRDVLYNYIGEGFFIPDENEYQTYKISELVMWLYEKHGIWISVWQGKASENFGYRIQGKESFYEVNYFRLSPTEAYEAAIKYTLNNLI